MSSSTIQDFSINPQYCQDDMNLLMNGAFTKLLHNLIREHGTYKRGDLTVDVKDFTLTDKRLLLAYYMDANELEYAYQSENKTHLLFEEIKNSVQELADDQTYSVYCDAMEEKGCSRCTYPDNDEVYWRRR